METALISLGVISLAEVLLWSGLWRLRKYMAPVLAGADVVAAAVLIAANPAAWTVLIAIASAYRCVNLARVATGRIQQDYLYGVSRRTAFWLISGQLILTAIALLNRHYGFDDDMWLMLAADVMLLCSAGLFAATLRHLHTTRPPRITRTFADADLPTLTVAIPARNETEDLERCLTSLLASTYPKLEVIVLDDCSQNKRTPEIIRGFAHAGVRFIAGDEPPFSWLAKNYAYKQLSEAANGNLLLFCGVDVSFGPDTLGALVKTMLQKQKAMISVLPKDAAPTGRALSGWFMQPNRYAWELALPRRLMKRPPVLSTCWMITREALDAAGGFDAVRRKGVPESYFARAAASSADGYSFLQADRDIVLNSAKLPTEQRATAVRTRYLQLHRRPEMTAAVGLAESALLVAPPVLAIYSISQHLWATAVLAGSAFVLGCAVYSMIFNLAYRRFILKGVWLLPLAAAYDIALLNYSMWRYEFKEVIWKGRNVCIPIMQRAPATPPAQRST